jgi:hypothetical protein
MHFQATRIKSLKRCFSTSGVVKNVFWCRIKSLKNYFLISGVVKNVFWCISKPPESSPYKIYFSTSGRVLMHFLATRIKSLKLFFNLWSGQTRVLMHFQTNRIKTLKIYFLMSGTVKNMFWCISRPPESSPSKR